MEHPVNFDVIIVGARCAGASLAVYLARAGLEVVLLDAAPLPSEQPMSTHLIQPVGMDELDGLDIGDAVRALTPALRAGRFDFDGREMTLPYSNGRTAHCLRRDKLDRLLQEAAVEAGAHVQPESRVVGLVCTAGGRVGGVEVRCANGTSVHLTASLVVGADGRNSTVAKLVGADEYLGYDGPRAAYWAYWRRPAEWDAGLLYNGSYDDHSRVLFPTDDDLVLIASSPPVERAQRWRADHTASYLADVRSFEPLASYLGGDEPVSRVRGMLKIRYFFRTAAGPGWALAGDAGHHKEFFVGLGISDALRDARSLATAILTGSDAALARYWRERDVARIEMFRWGQDLGRADTVTQLERLIAKRAATRPDMASRFGAVIDGRLSPYDLFPSATVAHWVVAAVARGDVTPIPHLVTALARRTRARLELSWRKRLRATVGAPADECPRARQASAAHAARPGPRQHRRPLVECIADRRGRAVAGGAHPRTSAMPFV